MSTSVWRSKFYQACIDLNIPGPILEKYASIIETMYSESHRYYHTLSHIEEMLGLLVVYEQCIQDINAVVFAILFHDIVYQPTSSTNEEDSATLFMVFAREAEIETGLANKVRDYIIETKKHHVAESSDEDLKIFIDFDMAVLGRPIEQYQEYAKQIRKEYIHVPSDEYCRKRAEFLSSVLADSTSTTYASDLFKSLKEQQSKDNMSWEHCELSKGRIPQ